MEENVDYKRAAKTTLLFSGVRVVTIIAGIIRNKIAAVLLGPAGVGIISIYNTYLNFVQTGAGLGLSQSAVRDVSEACEQNNYERFSRIISLTNKLVLLTAFLGIVVTILMSPLFSEWGFGNDKYVVSFVLLSLCAGMQVYVENRLAILKGMRRMRSLAYSTIIGSIGGLIVSAPLYFLYGEKGIVPVLLLTAFISLLVTNYYVNRIKYERVKLSFWEVRTEGTPMLKMGVALMMINFLSGIVSTIIISYLRQKGGLDIVAYYGTGQTIITSYFGIVLMAMTTDYYPRICGVYKDDVRLQDEVNAQSKIGMIMVFPLALIFVAFASFFIPLLYSEKFLDVMLYTDWALLGTIITVPSNCIAMILLAKQDAKFFTTISLIMNIARVFILVGGYELYGIIGLGIAESLEIAIQWLVYSFVMGKRYNIRFSNATNIMLVTILIVVIASVFAKQIEDDYLKYCVQFILILCSLLYFFYWSKKMDMNILLFIKNKIHKK